MCSHQRRSINGVLHRQTKSKPGSTRAPQPLVKTARGHQCTRPGLRNKICTFTAGQIACARNKKERERERERVSVWEGWGRRGEEKNRNERIKMATLLAFFSFPRLLSSPDSSFCLVGNLTRRFISRRACFRAFVHPPISFLKFDVRSLEIRLPSGFVNIVHIWTVWSIYDKN